MAHFFSSVKRNSAYSETNKSYGSLKFRPFSLKQDLQASKNFNISIEKTKLLLHLFALLPLLTCLLIHVPKRLK